MQEARQTAQALDVLMRAACQAVITSAASQGRSPYLPVFGKVPRFPGDLLGDKSSFCQPRLHL